MPKTEALFPVGKAALHYAETDWKVLPCKPGEKKPLTKDGVCDAADDQERIR
jgi:hypothetical protein